MKHHTIRWVFGFGLLAILGMIAFQVYWILSNYESRKEAVEQKIFIMLYNVAERLADYNSTTLRQEDLITRRSTNYFIVNINGDIDANLLEHFMLDEMNRANLLIDFEYAIYDCEQDQMVYGHYCNVDELPEVRAGTNLPKYEKFEYYFGVRFPQFRNTVLRDMTLTFILTGLLLLTLIFYGVALYIISSQRRLSILQRDFINNMTHEIKTPLSVIKIAGDTFLQDDRVRSDARLSKYASIVSDQTTKLNDQVEKILDIARFESDLVKLNKEKVDLSSLIRDVVAESKEKYPEAEIMNLHSASKATTWADPLHVANVLQNLIDNGIKYGGRPSKLSIDFQKRDGKAMISITDNGPGIPKSEQTKIFDKFYRIHTGDVHDQKGFGLGLFYVNQIIKLHKWAIDVDSQLGKGTTFQITLPLISA